jgi:hypothetical protein
MLMINTVAKSNRKPLKKRPVLAQNPSGGKGAAVEQIEQETTYK